LPRIPRSRGVEDAEEDGDDGAVRKLDGSGDEPPRNESSIVAGENTLVPVSLLNSASPTP